MSTFETYPNTRQNQQMNENIYDPVARIVVIGIGGAGNNAINHMIDDGVKGVEFVGVNTDVQDLRHCRAPRRVTIGEKITGGRGCGAIPEIGESAANESKEALRAVLRETETQKKADMVFITCGMGGGTGTGAAPIVAGIAKEEGIQTVAVVTKPFRFEGKVRMQRAISGINKLFPNVDTLISISNDKLLNIVDVKDGFREAFAKADEILKQSIRGITDLINLPALVNLDFADVATVMRGKGLAHIAIGDGQGENKVRDAITKAMESPLLDTTIDGATDIIISISGEVSLVDVDAAMRELEPKLSTEANIIFGAREDSSIKDTAAVTLIATGIRDMVNSYPSYKQAQTYQPQAYQTQNYQPQQAYQAQTYQQQFKATPYYTAEPIKKTTFDDLKPVSDETVGQPKTLIGRDFFAPKKKKEESVVENIGPTGTSRSVDSLNVDLSKIGFNKKQGNSKDLLPSFITNNLNK